MAPSAPPPVAGPARWRCGKCGHEHCELGEIRVSGGALSAVFDIEANRFTTVTCARCSHTELYRADRTTLAAVFDFFVT